MSSARTFLARHGVTQANLDRIHAGNTEIPLLGEGRLEAGRLADRAVRLGIREIWASPIRRARETAEIVAARGGTPLYFDRDLRELDAGPWQGLTDDAIRERFPAEFERWNSDPTSFTLSGRETLNEVRERMISAIERIRARQRTVLIISHSEPIRLLRVHYSGDDLNRFAEFMPGHGQLFELAPGPTGFELRPLS
jgi:probable phosphoglycerate mutase